MTNMSAGIAISLIIGLLLENIAIDAAIGVSIDAAISSSYNRRKSRENGTEK